jgi:hypothetical protein
MAFGLAELHCNTGHRKLSKHRDLSRINELGYVIAVATKGVGCEKSSAADRVLRPGIDHRGIGPDLAACPCLSTRIIP